MKYGQLNNTTITLALLLFFIPCLAIADQKSGTGFYVSGGVGVSSIDSDLNLKKDSGVIPRVAAGWQITPFLGIETSYHNFLEFEDPIATLARYDVSGISLAGTLRLPVSSRVAFFFKLGQMWWNTDLFDTSCSRGPAGCSTTKYDVSETDSFVGLGIGYELSDRFELELEYDYFDFGFGSDLDYFDNKTSSIAVSIKFDFLKTWRGD